MTVTVRAELVLDAGATLGEGPVWDQETDTLLWVDIPARVFHRFDPSTGADSTYAGGDRVGAIACRRGGGLVLARADGFVLTDSDTAGFRLVAPIEPDNDRTRLNDGKCDSHGRFWAGTLGEPKGCRLYRFDPDGTVRTQAAGVSTSNGLGWSPDGRFMYYVDSRTGGVDVFDFDGTAGRVTNRRRLVDVVDGVPDGLCVDADGGIWLALWLGGAVHRYTPDGRLDRVVPVPVERVTSCAFGGPDLRTLFITTAIHKMSEQDRRAQPHAGGIFATSPGVRGLAPTTFAG